MADSVTAFLFVMVGILALALGFFYIGGMADEKSRWQEEAIKRGLAHYDPETAEWKWNAESGDANG